MVSLYTKVSADGTTFVIFLNEATSSIDFATDAKSIVRVHFFCTPVICKR